MASHLTERRSRPALILVVEDDADLRELVVLHLRTEGYDVAEAATASEAFWRVCDGINGVARRVDLVLTDVRLLTSSGLELVHALRGITAPTALMLMTAFPSVELNALTEGMGIPVLAKPFSMNELRAGVAATLGREAQAKEPS
jgi:two-component system NtrC family response regulator